LAHSNINSDIVVSSVGWRSE